LVHVLVAALPAEILGFTKAEISLPANECVKLFRLLTRDGRVPKEAELPGFRALMKLPSLPDHLVRSLGMPEEMAKSD
jgi:hypothetical protein